MSRLSPLTSGFGWGLLVLLMLAPTVTFAEDKPTPLVPVQSTAVTPLVKDARSGRRVVAPGNKLPPLKSVRWRGEKETKDLAKRGNIAVSINSSPRGARVLYGGRLLGTTPLTLTAPRHSTPFDVTLRRGGFMTLHARIKRESNRSYNFKLTPAKFQ